MREQGGKTKENGHRSLKSVIVSEGTFCTFEDDIKEEYDSAENEVVDPCDEINEEFQAQQRLKAVDCKSFEDLRESGRFRPRAIIGKGKYGTVLSATSDRYMLALKVIRVRDEGETTSYEGQGEFNVFDQYEKYPAGTFKTKLVSYKEASKETHFLTMFKECDFIVSMLACIERESTVISSGVMPAIYNYFFPTPPYKELWIALEMYNQNSALVYDVLARKESCLNIEDVKTMIVSLTMALQYINHLGYCHRDIKPGNVLLRYDRNQRLIKAVLCDFGACTSLVKCRPWTGTLSFLAPEYFRASTKVIKLKSFLKLDRVKKEELVLEKFNTIAYVDVYALGMTMLGWALGGNPFTSVKGNSVSSFLLRCARTVNKEYSHLYRDKNGNFALQNGLRDLFVKRYERLVVDRLNFVEGVRIHHTLTHAEYFDSILRIRSQTYPKLFGIISSCLNFDPEARPSFDLLLRATFYQEEVQRLMSSVEHKTDREHQHS